MKNSTMAGKCEVWLPWHVIVHNQSDVALYIIIILMYTNIQLLLFWGQYDDIATLEVQYSPRRRRGEYCTPRVAKSLHTNIKTSSLIWWYNNTPSTENFLTEGVFFLALLLYEYREYIIFISFSFIIDKTRDPGGTKFTIFYKICR